MKRNLKSLLSGAAGISVWLMATPVMAQDTPDAQQPAEQGATDGLAEVIITAQRVETNLQNTPVAVTALSADALEERGVTNILDLNSIAPNVSIGTRSGGGTASGAITIRGIGIDANPPASPAVGIYVDDVYLPASWGNLIGIFDVGRIEVLRGPQGTLFGRNTISGAIQYVGIKPVLNEISGYVDGTLGNLERRDISAAINLPLGSIAALRISGGINDRDGFVRDNLNDINRGSENVKQIRAQLRIQPTDGLTIDVKGEYLKQKSNGRASINQSFNYATVFGAPFAPSGLDQFISPSFYENAGYNDPDNFEASFKVVQGVISYDLTDDITLKSVTAYSDSVARLQVDQDNTPISILAVDRGTVTDKLFTQELQLSGNLLEDRLHFTLGVYYYDSKNMTVDSFSRVFNGPPGDPFGDYTIKTKSLAAYGQATFDITDQFSIVGGLRTTRERITSINAALPVDGKRTFTNTSPLVGLNFQPTKDILAYVKWSKGFRAGGFSPNISGQYYYGPETAETYEAGLRLQLLDRRVRINPTVFRTNWKNIQFNQIVLAPPIPFPLPIINNAGNARLTGAEVEVQAAVTRQFTITASGALLDGDYTTIAPSQLGKITLDSDLKRAPKASFTLGGRYEMPLANDGRIVASANYNWQAKQRSATTDIDTVNIPAYGLLSARLEYKSPEDRYSLALFATNLTDEQYIVGGTNYGRGGSIPVVNIDVGRPREYGVTARFNF